MTRLLLAYAILAAIVLLSASIVARFTVVPMMKNYERNGCVFLSCANTGEH
jgi:hypothetical protein